VQKTCLAGVFFFFFFFTSLIFYLKRVQIKFWALFHNGDPPKMWIFEIFFVHIFGLEIFALSKLHSPMCWNGWDFRRKQTQKNNFMILGLLVAFCCPRYLDRLCPLKRKKKEKTDFFSTKVLFLSRTCAKKCWAKTFFLYKGNPPKKGYLKNLLFFTFLKFKNNHIVKMS